MSRRSVSRLDLSHRWFEHIEAVVQALWLVFQHKLLELDENLEATRSDHKRNAVQVLRVETREAWTGQDYLCLILRKINCFVAVIFLVIADRL